MGYQRQDIINAVIGGIIISISSSLFLVLKGRITGISGMFFGVINKLDHLWKLYYLLGLLYISSIFITFIDGGYFEPIQYYEGDLSIIGFLVGGFLVGLGTKLANGCTSGHGLCGLPRLSKRSIVSVIIFLGVGILTAVFRYNVPFLYSGDWIDITDKINDHKYYQYILFTILSLILLIMIIRHIIKKSYWDLIDLAISTGNGMLFGSGLIISGMVKRSKIINFLNVSNMNTWDPSLLIVLSTSVLLNAILFKLILKFKKEPYYALFFDVPGNNNIDISLVIGSILFGMGWGITGLCPGPAISGLAIYVPHMVFFMLTCAVGMFCAVLIKKWLEKFGSQYEKFDG